MSLVLVTGGAGFIGSHLASELVAHGHQVRVLDNLLTGSRANLDAVDGHVELIEGDLRDPSACRRACGGVEFVFHLAALGSVPRSIEEPRLSHECNVDGTFNILDAAATSGVRRVIYASSSSVYGDVDVSPKHEGLTPMPRSPYAVQKLAGELYASVFCRCMSLETISLRYFNVFGARQNPKSQYAAAIPAFIMAILSGRSPTVYGDGEQTRDFTHVSNVVRANLRAMTVARTNGESVNIACGEQISVNEVIEAVNRALDTKVEPEHVDERPGEVRHSRADIERAGRLLDYQPGVSFAEGLAMAIDYYKSLAPERV